MEHSYGAKFIPIKLYTSQQYYHNLNVIRIGSKKLLTIKNSKSLF